MDEQKEATPLEQRMYVIVLYNLSPIQQGIQAAHAIVEHARAFGHTEEYQTWAGRDKTIIILNGGSSISLNEHFRYLVDNQIVDLAFFKEPDLYNGMTAFCFLADERIWNREKYPDAAAALKPIKYGTMEVVPAIHIIFDEVAFKQQIGGEKNFLLKEFLSKFRLA